MVCCLLCFDDRPYDGDPRAAFAREWEAGLQDAPCASPTFCCCGTRAATPTPTLTPTPTQTVTVTLTLSLTLSLSLVLTRTLALALTLAPTRPALPGLHGLLPSAAGVARCQPPQRLACQPPSRAPGEVTGSTRAARTLSRP